MSSRLRRTSCPARRQRRARRTCLNHIRGVICPVALFAVSSARLTFSLDRRRVFYLPFFSAGAYLLRFHYLPGLERKLGFSISVSFTSFLWVLYALEVLVFPRSVNIYVDAMTRLHSKGVTVAVSTGDPFIPAVLAGRWRELSSIYWSG